MPPDKDWAEFHRTPGPWDYRLLILPGFPDVALCRTIQPMIQIRQTMDDFRVKGFLLRIRAVSTPLACFEWYVRYFPAGRTGMSASAQAISRCLCKGTWGWGMKSRQVNSGQLLGRCCGAHF